MKVKYTDNLEEYKKQLARAGISIQTAGVEAINNAAYNLYAEYRRRLIAETALKSRAFTLAAPRVFPARHPVKGKAPRKLADINAKLIVPKMKGDKEHYLYQLETGAERTGDPRVGNRVPIPLDTARTGGSRASIVAGQYQMQKQFAYGGAIDLSIYSGEKARQGAILNDMGRRGKIAKNTYYTIDMGDAKYLARITGKKVSLLRNMNETRTKTPPEPMFEETTKTMTQAQMDYWFIKAVEKEMQKLS
jgi:hypothetical protein